MPAYTTSVILLPARREGNFHQHIGASNGQYRLDCTGPDCRHTGQAIAAGQRPRRLARDQRPGALPVPSSAASRGASSAWVASAAASTSAASPPQQSAPSCSSRSTGNSRSNLPPITEKRPRGDALTHNECFSEALRGRSPARAGNRFIDSGLQCADGNGPGQSSARIMSQTAACVFPKKRPPPGSARAAGAGTGSRAPAARARATDPPAWRPPPSPVRDRAGAAARA